MRRRGSGCVPFRAKSSTAAKRTEHSRKHSEIFQNSTFDLLKFRCRLCKSPSKSRTILRVLLAAKLHADGNCAKSVKRSFHRLCSSVPCSLQLPVSLDEYYTRLNPISHCGHFSVSGNTGTPQFGQNNGGGVLLLFSRSSSNLLCFFNLSCSFNLSCFFNLSCSFNLSSFSKNSNIAASKKSPIIKIITIIICNIFILFFLNYRKRFLPYIPQAGFFL